MALDILDVAKVIEVLENYMEFKRPPVALRSKVDLGYKMENQSIIIFEIREMWNKPGEYMESPVAKTTFVKRKNYWKVFWMRGNLKWHPYAVTPKIVTIDQFIELIEKDPHGCFWG